MSKETKKRKCDKCDALFLENQLLRTTKDGVYHVSCYIDMTNPTNKEERCKNCSTTRIQGGGQRILQNKYSEFCAECVGWVDKEAKEKSN